jgi:hypothetical protein
LAGDDFCPIAWQHNARFEPTLVFPLALYFAESIGSIIYGLPFNQFAIVVDHLNRSTFEFRDLTGAYKSRALRDALVFPNRGFFGRVLDKVRRIGR